MHGMLRLPRPFDAQAEYLVRVGEHRLRCTLAGKRRALPDIQRKQRQPHRAHCSSGIIRQQRSFGNTAYHFVAHPPILPPDAQYY